MEMKYIDMALKMIVSVALIWCIVDVVKCLEEQKQSRRYTLHSYNKVIDEMTGKVYDIKTSKLVFDPTKVR